MSYRDPINRSAFLRQSASLLALAVFGRALPAGAAEPDPGHAHHSLEHPEPRAGITAEHVLANDAIGSPRREKDVFEAYDAARAYPGVFDGIACACGCTGNGGTHRSLLVCYETKQPTGCISCQMEAKLVGEMAKNEKPLAEIRAAVDKKFR
jgi:hypothetical protein